MTQRRRLRLRRKRHVKRQLQHCERPLLTVYRSSRHIYAQILDPVSGKTLTGASTLSPRVRGELEAARGVDAAKKVGTEIARMALELKISNVSFNRNGFVYTGRVKALADAAREAGLRI